MIPNRCPKATLFSHFAGGQQVCIPPWVVSLESAGLGLDWMVGWLVGPCFTRTTSAKGLPEARPAFCIDPAASLPCDGTGAQDLLWWVSVFSVSSLRFFQLEKPNMDHPTFQLERVHSDARGRRGQPVASAALRSVAFGCWWMLVATLPVVLTAREQGI